MISYELAKQLKDAGWPQLKTKHFGEVCGYANKVTSDCYLATPTLEELIAACGQNLVALSQMKNGKWVGWYATGIVGLRSTFKDFDGSTLIEAVARLLLAINTTTWRCLCGQVPCPTCRGEDITKLKLNKNGN